MSLAALVRGWTGRKEGAAWVAVWRVAGVAIVRPDYTMDVAHALGVGRGADLVLYCAVIAMLIGFFMVYTRLRRLRRDITVLTRHLAIRPRRRPSPLPVRSRLCCPSVRPAPRCGPFGRTMLTPAPKPVATPPSRHAGPA